MRLWVYLAVAAFLVGAIVLGFALAIDDDFEKDCERSGGTVVVEYHGKGSSSDCRR